jgi:hypothetical protein
MPIKPLTGSTSVKKAALSAAERGGKANGVKANGSILSFFKKAESKLEEPEEGLFLPDEDTVGDRQDLTRSLTPEDAFGGQDWGRDGGGKLEDLDGDRASRFNEDGQAVKRRKLGSGEDVELLINSSGDIIEDANKDENSLDIRNDSTSNEKPDLESMSILETTLKPETNVDNQKIRNTIPELKRESTSYVDDDDFERLGDFDEDLYAEGEEFQERQWMEEQRQFELAENDQLDSLPGEREEYNAELNNQNSETSTESCPICSSSLAGISNEVCPITHFTRIAD